MSLLIPEIFTQLIIYAVLLFFLTASLFVSGKVILFWNFESSGEQQYILEKQTYLAALLMKYAFVVSIPSFLLFIYANDKLAGYLTGAMCAAGVLNATLYGKYLIVSKLINLYLCAAWLTLNYFDLKNETMPFTAVKFHFIPLIFICFLCEPVLFILHFASIDPTVPVSCCNVIFADNTNVLKAFTSEKSAEIFGASFILLVASRFLDKPLLTVFANILYAAAGIAVLIYSVSPYIYELPTHTCPFCILQGGYGYVGYLFYLMLFGGTALGAAGGIYEKISGEKPVRMLRLGIIFNTVYLILSVWFPAAYYIRNGTLL